MSLEFKQGIKVIVVNLEVINIDTLEWYLKSSEVLIIM